MRRTLYFLYLLSILSFSLSRSVPDEDPTSADTLVLVHVLFRHGNRTPEQSSQFPTDPHLNFTYEPFGYGQLTTKGKATEYAIGQFLRSTYGGFIPDQYTPDVVDALSTNFKRTKMSLELVLAGLFPPLDTDVFSEGINWQPIPYNIDEGHVIKLPFGDCSNYVRYYYRYLLTDEARDILSDYTELYSNLTQLSGREVSAPEDVFAIYETLESESDFGLELPEWSADVFPDILQKASAVDIVFGTAHPALTKLSAGFLLKKILEDSLAKRNGTLSDNRKIFLYSAHDYTVGVTLSALNVFELHVPPYGATVFFEIHNIGGLYSVRLYYQDYTGDGRKLLAIPGCSSYCDLDLFAKLIADNLPGEEDVCNSFGETN